jgi:hypothetical protein
LTSAVALTSLPSQASHPRPARHSRGHCNSPKRTLAWWIPLLVIIGVWRYARRHWPLTYDPALRSVVFPLGIYSVATLTYGKTTHVGFMEPLARFMFWVAVAAWVAVAGGFPRPAGPALVRLTDDLRSRRVEAFVPFRTPAFSVVDRAEQEGVADTFRLTEQRSERRGAEAVAVDVKRGAPSAGERPDVAHSQRHVGPGHAPGSDWLFAGIQRRQVHTGADVFTA